MGREGPQNQAMGPADPDHCERFVKESGVDTFAAAIGNAHGLYQGKPELRFDLLAEIERRTSLPLVLHGGTGIPEDDIRKAITMGVSKINFSTVMRRGFIRTLTETLHASPGELDLMKLLTPAKRKMVTIAAHHIEMCMSAGKAWR